MQTSKPRGPKPRVAVTTAEIAENQQVATMCLRREIEQGSLSADIAPRLAVKLTTLAKTIDVRAQQMVVALQLVDTLELGAVSILSGNINANVREKCREIVDLLSVFDAQTEVLSAPYEEHADSAALNSVRVA